MSNYFAVLNAVDVRDHQEKKNGLTYLSWAWAWAEIKKLHPDANYTIYEDANGCFYHNDGNTCWVKTGVTVNGIEHIEYLPVMDHRNKSIPLKSVTSFDVNKTIQRSLTKACARHGLGLYIYAGEDLPEDAEPVQKPAQKPQKKPENIEPMQRPEPAQKRMATPEQIEFIVNHSDDQTYENAMMAFGANLEKMSYKQAEKLIERMNAIMPEDERYGETV
jgi:hypothetical protein